MIVHIGLLPGFGGIDIRKITLQEVTVIGTYCYTMMDFRETVAAMAAGRLCALDCLEERPLSAGTAAMGDINADRAAAAKIVLRPNGGSFGGAPWHDSRVLRHDAPAKEQYRRQEL